MHKFIKLNKIETVVLLYFCFNFISCSGSVTSESAVSSTSSSGSVFGYAYLSDSEDHSGITVTIGDQNATTASDGSYQVDSVSQGSHQVTYSHTNDCSITGSVVGQANFSDARSDRSGATIVLQYNPECYTSEERLGIVVFDEQSTEVEDVTLSKGESVRASTTTDTGGSFVITNVPAGTYTGSLPTTPTLGVGIYEQAVGTYALAISTDGLEDTTEIYNMRAYPIASFRNDPYFQNTRDLEVIDSASTDLGEIALYPMIYALSTDAFHEDYPYSGLDLSAGTDVSSTDASADIYFSFENSVITINGSSNVQESGSSDMQSLITAPSTGYGGSATIDTTGEDDWGNYPENYNTIFTIRTQEGNYAKVKLLPSCTISSSTISLQRCFDVLYYYQADGSVSFSY